MRNGAEPKPSSPTAVTIMPASAKTITTPAKKLLAIS